VRGRTGVSTAVGSGKRSMSAFDKRRKDNGKERRRADSLVFDGYLASFDKGRREGDGEKREDGKCVEHGEGRVGTVE